MKMVAMKCPECGASLRVDLDKETASCEFCGTSLFLQDENQFIIHNVDEAEVIRARTEREKWEKSLEEAEKKKRLLKRIAIACLIVAVIAFGAALLLYRLHARFMTVMVAVDIGMLCLAVLIAILANSLNGRR